VIDQKYSVALDPQAKPRIASHEVAFFSLEYALDDRLPFAGGLGVLAADYLLECGKQGFPLIGVGLAYSGIEKLDFAKIDNYYLKEFGAAKLFLLDGGELTKVPYGPDRATMIRQQAFLGFEGVKLLQKLGIAPEIYHLNEGHTAFVVLALIKTSNDQPALPAGGRPTANEDHLGDAVPNALNANESGPAHEYLKYAATADERLRWQGGTISNKLPKIVATKHTVLSVSGLHLTKDELRQILGEVNPEANVEELYALGSDAKHPEFWSANKFLLRHAAVANGVSVKHVQTEIEVHPNSPLINITNGINPDRWLSPNSHNENKKRMIEFVNSQTGTNLNPEKLTVVWARRLAEYKQPELIISDLEKLAQIPAQFILAGTARPDDPTQQSMAERLGAAALNPKLRGNFVFLPHYNLEISKILTAGADVWLNTPVVGKEACGTSGMKSGLNGALLVSTNDGWMAQENWERENSGGFLLGDIYEVLQNKVCPLWENKEAWSANMAQIKKLIQEKYLTARMLEDYKRKLYSL